MSIDSENSLFKQITNAEILNLIERSQFEKRRRKLFLFSEEVRTKLASYFLEFENYFIVDSMPLQFVNSHGTTGLKYVKMLLKLLLLKVFALHGTTGFMDINFTEYAQYREFFIRKIVRKPVFTMFIF